MIKKNLANIITLTRIIGTFVMIFTDIFSVPFYIAYIYSGVSDVLDGYIARKLKIESAFGRKLDSISDLFFYIVMMVKILPYLKMYLPTFVWVIIFVTLAIRVLLYAYGYFKKHTLISNHTILNKMTGFLMFFLPFMVKSSKLFIIYSTFVSIFAILAAIYEMVLVINNKEVI